MTNKAISLFAACVLLAVVGFIQPRAERAEAQLNLGLQKPTLTVFCRSKPICPPCITQKTEYQQRVTIINLIEGHALSGVEFYSWDAETGKWDKPGAEAAYANFVRTTGHKIDSWPTLWLSGSHTWMEGKL